MASIIGTLIVSGFAAAFAGGATLIALGDVMLALTAGGFFGAAMFAASCRAVKLN